MKYSKDYSKLGRDEYTTLRRSAKGELGDIMPETHPNGSHQARIERIERRAIWELTTEFLLRDTDCLTRRDAIALIQSFYKKPIEHHEKLYVHYMKKEEDKRKW